MKKLGLLLLLGLTVAAYAQQADTATAPVADAPQGPIVTRSNFPIERVQNPTYADLYCAGFISKKPMPDASYVAGGLQTPNNTKYVNGDLIYLAGTGYQVGQQYTILRELRDANEYELYPGQHAMMKTVGSAYGELARVRVMDTRHKLAIAQIEFSCDPVNPGDFAIPFVEKAPVSFRPPTRFDRYLPANGKLGGRIVMSRDFDSVLGPGMKLYMNVGSDQGVKVGDYFRAVRSYSEDLDDPVDSLSFKASTSEDTQKKQPSINPHMFTKNAGPTIMVQDMPRRSVGEIVVVGTTPTTSTGMVVFALEDVHAGDQVELDDQQ
jgi:hypothetical protein